jgi:hypothetical protein
METYLDGTGYNTVLMVPVTSIQNCDTGFSGGKLKAVVLNNSTSDFTDF